MNNQPWTPETVAKRFEEAVETLDRLPPVVYLGFTQSWPESVVRVRDCLEEPEGLPIPPSPDAIDQMEEVLEWVTWVTEEERELIWMRAEHVRWKTIMRKKQNNRTHVGLLWKMGLTKIAIILNFLSQQKMTTKMCRQKIVKSV